MRLDGMTQQISWTEFSAKTTLVAGAFSDANHLPPVPPFAFYNRMVPWEDDDPARSFLYQGFVIFFQMAHHHPTDHVLGVRNRGPTGSSHTCRKRSANWRLHRYRPNHRAGHGDKFGG
jgi:hypothetical protein